MQAALASPPGDETAIAIVGMAGRFPRARDLDQFWENLMAGVDCVSVISPEELRAAGVPEALIAHPQFVAARAVLEDADQFDAEFFGVTRREAEAMDPQQRLLLECAWEALEVAGYPPASCSVPVGVFAGASSNWYVLNVWSNPAYAEALGETTVSLGNDKDHLATRIAYKLDLRGPCVNVQCACSTSLVAVHLACQSLLAGECDMALAGGASVHVRQHTGYLAIAGGTGSRAGRTAAFDAAADGTVGGSGVGMVVLKRLDDALRDRDLVHAVIRGSAANNDGASKLGYAAPSVDGQAQVIERALELAAVPADGITYVEAHGTGTALGDPVEVAALTQAFRRSTAASGFCALGSVKSNLGHLDSAAGIAGLIKAVLMVREGKLVPSLHYHRPNPHIDFAGSPFHVVTELRDWRPPAAPRRAGVSSFGLGGTNVHMVIEEAPLPGERVAARAPSLLVLSARTPGALAAAARRLARHLERHPRQPLGDLAYTLQVGRQPLPHRWSAACVDAAQAIAELADAAGARSPSAVGDRPPRLCFLFPGLGCQLPGGATELHAAEPVFRTALDACCAILEPILGFDLRELLVDGRQDGPPAIPAERIYEGWIGQPAVFVVEYALARLLMAWGLRPAAMLGHSLGEYTAACLSGVLGLPDALRLVAERARLMDLTPPGGMLGVAAGEAAVAPLLAEGAAIAIVNAPEQCVVAGSPPALDRLEARLRERGIETRRLRVARAFHSPAMEPVLSPFAEVVAETVLASPRIPYLSNVTGSWVTDQEARDPGYWVRHLREPVRFGDGLRQLAGAGDVLLEVGPTQALSGIAREVAGAAGATILSALPAARDTTPRRLHLLRAVGRLWEAGVEIDWEALHAGTEPRRVTAPTYAWDHRRYWAVPDPAAAERLSAGLAGGLSPATAAAFAAPAAMAPGEAGAVAAPGEAGQVVAAAGEPLGEPAAGEELGEVGGEIAALWRRMLGVPRVRPGDGFLALGGDSLLALQLTAKLNERFGAGLSLHAVLEARTLAGLAAAVETARRGGGMVSQIPLVGEQIPLVGEQVPLVGERDPLVVELEPGAGDAPLFLLHAVGGSVFGYAPLAAGLRDGQPILGIQPQGFDGAAPLLTTVEEMAERHLQAIRSVQSRGPYYLAGASFGGTLAYAVACRLRAAGERVALLAMIDTPGPGAPLARISSSADVLIEIFGSRLQLDREQLAALDGERQIDWVLARLAAAGQPVPDLDRATAARRIELWRTNYQAMLAYAPPPYPGRAVFFRARQQPAGSAPERAWLELAEAGLETQIVPGDHQTMMAPPHLQVLIERLRKTLTAARFLTSRGDPAASVATKELR